LDANEEHAERLLIFIRIALLLIAVAAVWGTSTLVDRLKINLFDFVYFVIIPQLALFGAVLASLSLRERTRAPMWIAIVAGLVTGFACAAGGTVAKIDWLSDGAGTFTALISFLVAWVCTRERTVIVKSEVATGV
jgi:Na+/proline symporter